MKILYTQLPKFTKLTLLCLSILLFPLQSYAKDVTFTWLETSKLIPITGYKLYYKTGEISGPPYDGTDINEGISPIWLGNITTYKVTGLTPNKTYQFAIKAYNNYGESIEYSDAFPVLPAPFLSPTINSISNN